MSEEAKSAGSAETPESKKPEPEKKSAGGLFTGKNGWKPPPKKSAGGARGRPKKSAGPPEKAKENSAVTQKKSAGGGQNIGWGVLGLVSGLLGAVGLGYLVAKKVRFVVHQGSGALAAGGIKS